MPLQARIVSALPAVALLALIPSCDLFCDEPDLSCGGSAKRESPECATDMSAGCNAALYFGGLEVDLPSMADGTYVLEGSADGEPYACPLTLTSGSVALECPGWAGGWWEDAEVRLETVPCEVSIALRTGEGTAIASGTFRPHYEWDEPNGEGCGWRGLARVELVRADG